MDFGVMLAVVLGFTPVSIIIGLMLYGNWRETQIEKEAPLPQINRIEELIEEHIASHRGAMTITNSDFQLHREWQKEFDTYIEDAKFEELKAKMPFDTTGLTKEGSVLKIIQLMEKRYGFYHPKTQEAIRFHEANMKRWHKEHFEKQVRKNDAVSE